MPVPTSCPPAERLRLLLDEKVAAGESSDLLTHVGACEACQRALEQLAGADPSVLGAGVRRTSAAAPGSHLRRVLDDLITNPDWTASPRPVVRAEWVRSLLRPAESPGLLGRLENYEVTELIGQGGMGLVLKAYDPGLKRWVAIKVLLPHLAHDDLARRRFAREAQAAAAVRDPHVVTIHAVREIDDLPFLVMEYVAGSLEDYLDRHGPPGWRTVARLGAEIAAGLAAAHARGLVHRDIKPSNVLLHHEKDGSEPGSVKISDFGLARVADEARLTQTGVVAGTPLYMAPEQALGQPLDERADLFSLGSVLYLLCTGSEPFTAEGPMAVLRRVCDATPTPIRDRNPDVPPWLAATVERLHAKRPADRFGSAEEVAELLRYNLRHPEEPRLPPPAKRGRWRRHLAAGMVVVGLLLLGGWWLKPGSREPTDQGAPREVRVPLRATLAGHTGPVWSAAFAPDGLTLATGGDDSAVRFWDVATGRARDRVLSGHGSAILVVAFAHSGKFLLHGGGDGNLGLWDVAAEQELPPLVVQHRGAIRRAPLSPDDRTFVLANSTQGVELWDVAERRLRQTLPGLHGSILAIAFAPDGQTLATGDAGGFIHLWDPVTGQEETRFPGDPLGVRALAFTPDSRTFVSAGHGDKDVKLWDSATHSQFGTLPGDGSDLGPITVSPNGHLLAAGTRDGNVRLWDLWTTQPLATLHAHQGSVSTVAFSPDGRTLATGGEDRLVKLWDLAALDNPSP
jgi:eukaryotic-like serine/threonine-protein kinase